MEGFMKELFDWLFPATKRDLDHAMERLEKQIAELRKLIAQASLNFDQKIFAQLRPNQEDIFKPAKLNELEESLGQDADNMELPDDLELGGNKGNWGDGNRDSNSSAIIIDHTEGSDIERRINDLPTKCGEEFMVFAIERWDSDCPPKNYAAKLREVQLRGLRQANIICQQLVRDGMLCERVAFVDWAYIGWVCPDTHGKAVIAATMQFRCIGS
jgi:hypothetical protein